MCETLTSTVVPCERSCVGSDAKPPHPAAHVAKAGENEVEALLADHRPSGHGAIRARRLYALWVEGGGGEGGLERGVGVGWGRGRSGVGGKVGGRGARVGVG